MAFVKLNLGSAESTDGFRVERIAPHDLRYSEGGRTLRVQIEPGVGAGVAIYEDSISSWGRYEWITVEERRRIVANICAALEFLGVDYLVE